MFSKSDIYVSYCLNDPFKYNIEMIEGLKGILSRIGYILWECGQQNDLENIFDGISNSKIVIACISKAYLEDASKILEYSFAYSLGMPVLTVLVENIDNFSLAKLLLFLNKDQIRQNNNEIVYLMNIDIIITSIKNLVANSNLVIISLIIFCFFSHSLIELFLNLA